MRHSLTAIFVLLTLFLTNTCFAQTNQNSDQQVETIKRQVEKFGVRKKVTVVTLDNKNLFGRILNIEADYFDLDEINSKQLVRVRFDQVKKVKKGLGNLNAFTGKRVNPPNQFIVGAIVIGAIVGLGVLVASQAK